MIPNNTSPQKPALFFMLLISLTGCLYGYNIGVISGLLLFVKKQMTIGSMEASFFVSSFLWGIVLMVIIMSFIADKLGRKKIILFGAALEVFSIFWMAQANSPSQLISGRLLIGCSCGMLTLTAPLYLTEVLPEHIRGRGTLAYQLFLTFGILLATLICLQFNKSSNWRVVILFELIPATIVFIAAFFIPESQRWLMLRDQQPEKYQALKKKYLLPLFLAICLGAFNQLTGINVFLQYDSIILLYSGFNRHGAALLGSTLITSINFLMTCVSIFLIDHFERKKLLRLGLIGIIICLLGMIGVNILMPETFLRGVIVTMLLLGFIIFFAMAPGAMIWTLRSEILPTRIRNFGLSVSLIISSFCAALYSTLFLSMQKMIGLTGVYSFSLIITILYLLTSFFIPNTSKRSLEEIEREFLRQKKI